MKRATGLTKEIEKKIVKLILSYKRPERIVLFGSRATGCFAKTSDIDIAVFDKKWNEYDTSEVRALLDERLSTPLKVDLLDFYSLRSQRLKKSILREGRILYGAREIKGAS